MQRFRNRELIGLLIKGRGRVFYWGWSIRGFRCSIVFMKIWFEMFRFFSKKNRFYYSRKCFVWVLFLCSTLHCIICKLFFLECIMWNLPLRKLYNVIREILHNIFRVYETRNLYDSSRENPLFRKYIYMRKSSFRVM